MALLTYTDLEQYLNIDLATVADEQYVNSLALAVQAWADSYCGYPLEAVSRSITFDGLHNVYFLPTGAPVDPTSVVVEIYNHTSNVYGPYHGTFRATAEGRVRLLSGSYIGFQETRITYIAGWTSVTVPQDLKQALVELLAHRFQAAESSVSSGEPQLKRVTAGAYTEEYAASSSASSSSQNIPTTITEVLDRYKRPFAL